MATATIVYPVVDTEHLEYTKTHNSRVNNDRADTHQKSISPCAQKTAYDSTNPNGFVLSEADTLYVVHIGKGNEDEEAWSAGGPVQPDLRYNALMAHSHRPMAHTDTDPHSLALARYPHKVVVLEAGGASLQSVMTEWIDRNRPDVLVFGA